MFVDSNNNIRKITKQTETERYRQKCKEMDINKQKQTKTDTNRQKGKAFFWGGGEVRRQGESLADRKIPLKNCMAMEEPTDIANTRLNRPLDPFS